MFFAKDALPHIVKRDFVSNPGLEGQCLKLSNSHAIKLQKQRVLPLSPTDEVVPDNRAAIARKLLHEIFSLSIGSLRYPVTGMLSAISFLPIHQATICGQQALSFMPFEKGRPASPGASSAIAQLLNGFGFVVDPNYGNIRFQDKNGIRSYVIIDPHLALTTKALRLLRVAPEVNRDKIIRRIAELYLMDYVFPFEKRSWAARDTWTGAGLSPQSYDSFVDHLLALKEKVNRRNSFAVAESLRAVREESDSFDSLEARYLETAPPEVHAVRNQNLNALKFRKAVAARFSSTWKAFWLMRERVANMVGRFQ